MPTTKITTVGIDLGKNIFYLTGFDERGTIVIRQKTSPRSVLPIARHC